MRRFLRAALFAWLFLTALPAFAQNYGNDTLEVSNENYEEEVMVGSASDTVFSVVTNTQAVDVRKLPEQKLRELKASDDYWYANAEPEKKAEPKAAPSDGRRPLVDQRWFRNLLWLVILCSFIGVVVWYLASSNIRLFRRDSKKILEEEEDPGLAEDIFAINYEIEIGKAVAAQNYRLAVRLWYLRTLKELAERNVINWRPETPNGAYATHLYNSRFYAPFFRLTRNFEYTWYGGFAISQEAYAMMRTDFQTFLNSLPA